MISEVDVAAGRREAVQLGTSAPAAPPTGTDPRGFVADAVDTRFLKASSPAAVAVTRVVAALYARLVVAIRTIPGCAFLTRDHYLFFVLAVIGWMLMTPRFLVLARFVVERVLLGMSVSRPDLAGWPYVPALVVPLAVTGLVTFSLGTSARLTSLVVVSLLGGLAFGYLDLTSLAVFAAFVAACFVIIRLPIGRLGAALSVCALANILLVAASRWLPGTAILALLAFQTPLIPMLWYSAYEHKVPRRPLPFRRFSLYLYTRFFGGSVLAPGDLNPVPSGPKLSEVRYAGIRALYVAGVASIFAAVADFIWSGAEIGELRGLSLLGLSYLGYVGSYCKAVVGFNIVTGILRLFGLPLRDNFHYWLLARTPNEHWQRWNILFREWVVTFVFFPIMRAKRWLFASIMASLLVSALLHLVPITVAESPTFFRGVIELGYWVINGLAIYLVIKIPLLVPRLVPALRIRDNSVMWSIIGVFVTSSFYGILHAVRATSGSWADVADFFGRLVRIG